MKESEKIKNRFKFIRDEEFLKNFLVIKYSDELNKGIFRKFSF